MKSYFLLVLLSVVITYLTGCETNPPNTPNQVVEYGKVFVSSDINSAKIYLDDALTNYFTPDTIIVSEGEHKISLLKEGYTFNDVTIDVTKNEIKKITINSISQEIQKIVLLEDFANVSCDPCVVSNSIIEELNESYNGRIVVVKYSANFPSPYDPFYLSASDDNDERMSFYNILFAPTIIIDGTERPVATDKDDIQTKIDDSLKEDLPFNLTIKDSTDGGSLLIDVVVETLNTNELDFDNLVLHTVIIEKEIEFLSPPGSNGETNFHNVMRKMLPNENGVLLLKDAQVGEVTYSEQITIDPVWNFENINIVAFIQDRVTRKIYQAKLKI